MLIFELSAIFVYVLAGKKISSQVLFGIKICQALNLGAKIYKSKSKF